MLTDEITQKVELDIQRFDDQGVAAAVIAGAVWIGAVDDVAHLAVHRVKADLVIIAFGIDGMAQPPALGLIILVVLKPRDAISRDAEALFGDRGDITMAVIAILHPR